MKLIKNLKFKYSMPSVIFATSIFSILLAKEGSFTIQTILPFIILMVTTNIFKSKLTLLTKKSYIFLILLNITYLVAAFVNCFFYGITFYTIIQLLYQLIIMLWFIFSTQNDFDKNELLLFVKCVILYAFLSSIYVLYNNVFLGNRIFSITSLYGIVINKNHFATFTGIALLFSLYLILYRKKSKCYYYISFVVILLGILFSNSRAAIISAILSCMFAFMHYLLYKKISRIKLFTIILIPFVLILSYKPIISLIPNWMFNRYFVNTYNDDSNQSRLSRWENAIEGIENSPIIGYGPRNVY